MDNSDKTRFAELLATAGNYYDQQPKTITSKLPVYWEGLKQYDFQVVSNAVSRYTKNEGKFMPKIADIVRNIIDGRLTADEAWAIALKSADENITIAWTDEIAEAWNACSDIYFDGDKIGARMAFKGFYERLIADRRGQSVKWTVSLGNDPSQRNHALRDFQAKGLISPEKVESLLIEQTTAGGAELARLVFEGEHPTGEQSETAKAELLKIRGIVK